MYYCDHIACQEDPFIGHCGNLTGSMVWQISFSKLLLCISNSLPIHTRDIFNLAIGFIEWKLHMLTIFWRTGRVDYIYVRSFLAVSAPISMWSGSWDMLSPYVSIRNYVVPKTCFDTQLPQAFSEIRSLILRSLGYRAGRHITSTMGKSISRCWPATSKWFGSWDAYSLYALCKKSCFTQDMLQCQATPNPLRNR
jgi:hypothetical protein